MWIHRLSGSRTLEQSDGAGKDWSGRADLNRGPPAPKAGALPGCATPRHEVPCNYRALLIFLTPQSPSRAAAAMLRLSRKSDGQLADFLATFRGQIQRTEANAKLLEKSWCPRIVCVKLPTLTATRKTGDGASSCVVYRRIASNSARLLAQEISIHEHR